MRRTIRPAIAWARLPTRRLYRCCKVRRVTIVGSKKMVVRNDLADDEKSRIYDKGVEELETDQFRAATSPIATAT